MRVSQRLFLAVLPAVLGVALVAALAYWGQYAHAAPHLVVITAAVAVALSLVMAWRNTRYVAQRIEQLAEKVHGGARPDAAIGAPPRDGTDELDAIESVVDRFTAAIATANAARDRAVHSADARIREHAALLAETSAALAQALTDIRLPLHILLENRFGDLNENQEEVLEAARAAAEHGATALRRLGEIAALDDGTLALRRDRVRVGDVIDSLRPTLDAAATRAGVHLLFDVQPALPGVLGDRARLSEAIALLLADCVERSPKGGEVAIALHGGAGVVRLEVRHGAPADATVAWVLARRIVEAHGGNLTRGAQRLGVTLPSVQVVSTS